MFDPTAPEIAELSRRSVEFITRRLDRGAPLGRTLTPAAAGSALEATITADGMGVDAAFDRFEQAVVPNCIGLDSPRFLAFIPAAPSPAAVWFDAVIGAATFWGRRGWRRPGRSRRRTRRSGSWRISPGCPRKPAAASSAAARRATSRRWLSPACRRHRPGRTVAVADTVHASVDNALRLLGLSTLVVRTGADARLTGTASRAALDGDQRGRGRVDRRRFGRVDQCRIVDALDGIAEVCAERSLWFHVDGAYGAAALMVDELRPLFAGIERADSLIVDPHKWLFAPLDCCALLYRDPARARAVHTQRGPYIDVLHVDDGWNPSDHAFHLTRRARGLPLWFGLAAHGTRAYADAVRHAVRLAALTASRFSELDGVEVVLPPELGVVLFRRAGWDADRWRRWARELLAAGIAFVAPTSWHGETVGRLVFLHPRTPLSIVEELVTSLL